MELIDEVLQRGEHVLYLLPEIALTRSVIARLRVRFGERVAVFHSAFHNVNARSFGCVCCMIQKHIRWWWAHGRRSFCLITGWVWWSWTRSTTPSYKQHDPAPRYNARDMALVLAGLHSAKVLLGSATPSLESLYNARNGKYGFAALRVRFGDAALPTIVKVDLAEARSANRCVATSRTP
ncbi:MAG: hypothetical protein IPH00_11680 [Flavobacteriales bacterium]|nr:hypothetical protein [Flavobacteriales bacterium]